MKKVYLILCILGVILPYYHLIHFLIESNGSMAGFFPQLFATHPMAMISMDITVAASAFTIFLIHKKRTEKLSITKYIICLFMVGFSLALPLYLYDNLSTKENL
ncbi:DUF2834 domain-containing protein [Crocinitomicaceae bacterium]|jgi:hypothetical protein|nr:DUF2834 domain-containing protein [Crocinitomicaceae bacterium]MDB4650028.1 DUF2834 domain-containing protein [Crocinitomicaceae bacterium]